MLDFRDKARYRDVFLFVNEIEKNKILLAEVKDINKK